MTEFVLAKPLVVNHIERNDMGENPIYWMGQETVGDVPCIPVVADNRFMFVPLEDKKQQIRELAIGLHFNLMKSTMTALDSHHVGRKALGIKHQEYVDDFVDALVSLIYGEQQ